MSDPGTLDVYAQSKGDQAAADRTVELADELRQEFRYRDELYRDIDAVMYGMLPVEIPEAYRKTALEVHSPLAIHIVNTVAAALSTNPVSVQFRPVGFGDVHQQNATLREHFFEASWARQQEEARRRLTRVFMYSLAGKGEAVMKTIERCQGAWSEYTKKAADLQIELEKEADLDQDAKDRVYNAKTEDYKLGLPYPIWSTDVPPETFYYSRNEHGFTSCVEIKQLPYSEALERFGAGLDKHGKIIGPKQFGKLDPRAMGLARAEWSDTMRGMKAKTITVIEAWDYEVQAIVLIGPGDLHINRSGLGKGTLCKVVRHAYGEAATKTLRGPYFHALGITTASRLPERAGLSVLFGFLRLFPLLDSLLTAQGNAAIMTMFPAFKRTLPPGSIPGLPEAQMPYGADQREVSAGEPIVLGEIYPYDIMPIDQPKAGQDAEKLIQNVQTMLELALPSVVQGVIASDQSGYALNQAAHLARLAWDPIVGNAEIALGERTGFESWLIERRIGEKVYAWGEQYQKGRLRRTPTKAAWLGIGPDDLDGVHRYVARLDPETPSNKVIETRALVEQMNARLITYEDAVDQSGSNPDEVERSWMTQDIKKSPEVQQMIKSLVFQKVGTIQSAKLAAAGMPSLADMTGGTPPNMNPQATLGGPGAPPPNPVPMPGMGMPLAPPPPPGAAGMMMPPGGLPSAPPQGMVPGTPNVPQGMLPQP